MCRDGCFDHHRSMENVLNHFSTDLADLVERAGQSAIAIEARHRIGSSGFLWKAGLIVTAEHALRRDEDIPVILPDSNVASAQLVGRDPGTDIAVLRLDGVSAPQLTSAPQLRAGEIVVAVGRHGPGALAAVGIVSTAAGPWKTWRGGQLDALLRLDIGAYPRSSGSAVVDTQGRFAGMLTTGLTRTAPVAIPAATIDRIAAELVAHGRVPRGYLGVGLQPVPVPAAYAKLLNRTQRSGVMVLSVEPNGPAENGGILLGDLIVEIGGQPVTDTDDVQIALRGSIGRELPVVVVRSGQRVEFGVTIGERPELKKTQ
jgi:S1-C subfamily serine protease